MDYCLSRFGVVVERPAIFDEEIEQYAYFRCLQIWKDNFPSEPFDLLSENIGNDEDGGGLGGGGVDELVEIVELYKHLCQDYSDLFVFEPVFLVSAMRRYVSFLHVCEKLIKNGSGGLRLVPASDILLMWQTHQVRFLSSLP